MWETMDTAHIIEIMRVSCEIKYDSVSQDLLKMISQWLALNVNKVNYFKRSVSLFDSNKRDFTIEKQLPR